MNDEIERAEKIKKARLLVRLALSGERKFSLDYLNVIKRLCEDCSFSEKTIDGINVKINEAKKVFNEYHAEIQRLVEKGLREHAPVICKSKKCFGCRTAVSRVLTASIAVFCKKEENQEVFVRPYEIRLLKNRTQPVN